MTHLLFLVQGSQITKMIQDKFYQWEDLMNPEVYNNNKKNDEDQQPLNPSNEESVDLSLERFSLMTDQQGKKVDLVSWFLINSNIYFLFASLSVTAMMLPSSLCNLLLLLIMTRLVIKALSDNSQEQFYLFGQSWFYALTVISALTVLTQFTVVFLFHNDILLEESVKGD